MITDEIDCTINDFKKMSDHVTNELGAAVSKHETLIALQQTGDQQLAKAT